jgi:hypothetical protein
MPKIAKILLVNGNKSNQQIFQLRFKKKYQGARARGPLRLYIYIYIYMLCTVHCLLCTEYYIKYCIIFHMVTTIILTIRALLYIYYYIILTMGDGVAHSLLQVFFKRARGRWK